MPGGRPKIEIDDAKLKGLMRLKPTLKDTAAFFECSQDTIINVIEERFGKSFSNFRDENMCHTRFSLVRKAIKEAENGNNTMLIFCLKNLCGWADRYENRVEHKVVATPAPVDLGQLKDLLKRDPFMVIDGDKKSG